MAPGSLRGIFLRVIHWWNFYETGRIRWCMFYTVEPRVPSSAFGLEAHLCLQMLPTLFPFQKLRSLQLMDRWRGDPSVQNVFSLSVDRDSPTSDYMGGAGGSSFCKN